MSFAAPVGLSFALLFEILGWGIVAALLVIWRATFGAMLLYIAGVLDFTASIGPFSHTFHLGHPFRVANTAVHDWLDAEREGLSIEIGWTWHALKETWQVTAQMLEWAVRETDATFDWLTHVHVPRVTRVVREAAVPATLLHRWIDAAVAAALPKVLRLTHVITHTVEHATITVVRRVVHTAVHFPAWVIRLPHRVGTLERDAARVNRRLRALEKAAGATAFAALLANALGVSVRCVRSGNVRRAARAICGLDAGIFAALLAGVAVAEYPLSLQKMAREFLAVEDEVVKLVTAGVTELDGIV